jgi:hypothetical protein
MVPPRRG